MSTEKDLLTALEVCVLVHCSYNTLNGWYRWKNLHPDNEYAQLLPDYIQRGIKQERYWKREDVEKLIKFRQSLPQGRSGIMGDVTQKWRRAKKERENKPDGEVKRKRGRPRKSDRKS